MSRVRFTDVLTLCELTEAQRIINKHIDDGFVTDFCHDQQGYFRFSYIPELYIKIAAGEAATAYVL